MSVVVLQFFVDNVVCVNGVGLVVVIVVKCMGYVVYYIVCVVVFVCCEVIDGCKSVGCVVFDMICIFVCVVCSNGGDVV